MKSIIPLCLMTFLLLSCGKTEDADIIAGAVVVEDLTPYVEEFKSRMELANIPLRNDTLIVKFADNLSSGVLGTCGSRKDLETDHWTRTVSINQEYWPVLSESGREQLLFHELGHCLLIRGHDNSVDENGDPMSIMNQYHIGFPIYLSRYEPFMQELFSVTAPLFVGITFNGTLYASTLSHQSIMIPLASEASHFECGWKPNDLDTDF